MSFARIWTALMAGAATAILLTLCYAFAPALLTGLSPIRREALNPVFPGIWALVAAALLVPSTLLSQWLLAIRITAASMFLLASLGLATSTSTFLPAVAGGIGVLLAALTSALAGRPGPIPDRGETAPIRRG